MKGKVGESDFELIRRECSVLIWSEDVTVAQIAEVYGIENTSDLSNFAQNCRVRESEKWKDSPRELIDAHIFEKKREFFNVRARGRFGLVDDCSDTVEAAERDIELSLQKRDAQNSSISKVEYAQKVILHELLASQLETEFDLSEKILIKLRSFVDVCDGYDVSQLHKAGQALEVLVRVRRQMLALPYASKRLDLSDAPLGGASHLTHIEQFTAVLPQSANSPKTHDISTS